MCKSNTGIIPSSEKKTNNQGITLVTESLRGDYALGQSFSFCLLQDPDTEIHAIPTWWLGGEDPTCSSRWLLVGPTALAYSNSRH